MRAARLGTGSVLALLTAFVLARCLEPTQIRLELTSDACNALTQTGIAIGRPGQVDTSAFAAQQSGCVSAGVIGSIVAVPGASPDDPIAVTVIGGLGKDPASCTKGDPKCIVARRSLRYIAHTPLTLPIALDLSCAGVSCDDPATTCLDGHCVPANIDPSGCAGGTCALDGGATKDSSTVDASSDGSLDVGVADAAPVQVVLSSGEAAPAGIAVNGSDVYWTSYVLKAGTVRRAPIAGGSARTVASGVNGPYRLALDATSVYWTTYTGTAGDAVYATPLAGPFAVNNLATGTGLFGLAVSGGNAYFTEYSSPGAVRSVSTSGGIVTSLSSQEANPQGVVADAQSIYWTNFSNPGALMKCTVPNCVMPVPLLGNLDKPTAVAADATDVYVAVYGSGPSGVVARVPKVGGLPTKLAIGLTTPYSIAIDATSVYWTSYTDGTLRKCAKTGCNNLPTIIATGQQPYGVAVDATSVYWTDFQAGTINKLTPK